MTPSPEQATDLSGDDPAGAEPISFVIRMWRDLDAGPESPAWRGFITHVETGERRSVAAWDDITAFVQEVATDQNRPSLPS